ncbi:MAG: M28 family peptidase [Bdellovibrionales bacterium]|nr:M28 family peptidase [Bdellovibrionales bacterium]
MIASSRLSALAFTVLAAFFGMTSADADPGHPHLLWSNDHAAYRSYDPRGADRFFRPTRRTARPLRIDDDYLVESLKTLSGEHDRVLANRGSQAGRAAARDFLRKEFEGMGYTVSEQAYGSGTNLIAEKSGKSGKFLVMSAHYDSMSNKGADDDGSGVISLLGTARMLREVTLKHGIRFVAFDEEERGLVGSQAYAKMLVKKGEKPIILGDVEMEMLGWNARKDGKFHVISCKRADSDFLVGAFVQAVRNLGNGLQITEACTDRSDHASFWDQGMPAVVSSQNFFGGDSNPCYHRACDDVAHMHLDFFLKLAETAANAVRLIVAE